MQKIRWSLDTSKIDFLAIITNIEITKTNVNFIICLYQDIC